MREAGTVYFDGLCNLCNGFVDFVIRHDRQQCYRFAPLQGETARIRLPAAMRSGAAPAPTSELLTLVLEAEGRFRTRSDAALAILSGLGGVWRISAGLRLVPRVLRDWMYDYVARKRLTWFGRRPVCRVPTEVERARFLP